MKKLKTLVSLACLISMAACKKDDAIKPVKEMLPEKIYEEGKLRTRFFYSADYAIDSIYHYFPDTGLPWHVEAFELDSLARVKTVYERYYSSTDATIFNDRRVDNSYEGGKIIKSTSYVVDRPPLTKIKEFIFEYPQPQNIVVKELTAGGQLRRTRDYIMDKVGNIVEERKIVAPMFLTTDQGYQLTRTFDQQPSPWHLIAEKLPGYYSAPQSANNWLTQESFTEEGVLVTSTKKHEYNASGYVTKETSFEPDGSLWRRRSFEYITVEP